MPPSKYDLSDIEYYFTDGEKNYAKEYTKNLNKYNINKEKIYDGV